MTTKAWISPMNNRNNLNTLSDQQVRDQLCRLTWDFSYTLRALNTNQRGFVDGTNVSNAIRIMFNSTRNTTPLFGEIKGLLNRVYAIEHIIRVQLRTNEPITAAVVIGIRKKLFSLLKAIERVQSSHFIMSGKTRISDSPNQQFFKDIVGKTINTDVYIDRSV